MTDIAQVDWMSKAVNGVVYLAVCKDTGLQYVGITRKTLSKRISGHEKTAAKGSGREGTIWSDIRRFGIESFEFKVLEEVSTLGELARAEIKWISRLKTLAPSGYNQNRGGSVAPYPTTYVVDGQEFWGASELAEEYGIYVETVRKRLQAGWTPEQSVGLEPRPKILRQGKTFEVMGRVFQSERELCRAFKIPNVLFRARYHQMGWSLEQALDLEDQENPHEIRIAGVTFANLVAACRHYHLPKERVRSRLKSGWSLLQAFELEEAPRRASPKRGARQHGSIFPLVLNGKTFETCREIADEFGLVVSTVSYRIRQGWAPEEVAGLQRRVPKGKEFRVDGMNFRSEAEAARHFGISLRTLKSRLNYGWSAEEAVGLKERPIEGKRKYRITHPDGDVTICDNLQEFCREHSLPNASNLWQTANSDRNHSYLGFSAEFID